MKILDYINPKKVYNSLSNCITELKYYRKYKYIVQDLDNNDSLKKIGLTLKKDKLYFGVDLNPELLLYGDSSQETVEMKFVKEKMLKYTEFLKKQGILDSIVADYDRIQSPDYYGYVIEIKYAFREYSISRLIYNISYFVSILGAIATSIIFAA